MSYQEKGGRAGGENSAPDNEVLGLGSLNTDGDTHSVSGDTPLFKPDQLAQFDKTHYELIRLHSPDARDERGRPIGKAPFKGWRHCDALTASEAREAMETGHNVGVRLSQTDLVVDIDPRNFNEGDDPAKRLEADLGVTGSEIVFFDDLQPNVDAALERGWDAIRIDHETETVPQIRAALQDRRLLDSSRSAD